MLEDPRGRLLSAVRQQEAWRSIGRNAVGQKCSRNIPGCQSLWRDGSHKFEEPVRYDEKVFRYSWSLD